MPSLSGKAKQAPVQHTVTAAPYVPQLWDVVQVGAHPAELCQLQMGSEVRCWGLRSVAGGAGELMLERSGPAVAAGSHGSRSMCVQGGKVPWSPVQEPHFGVISCAALQDLLRSVCQPAVKGLYLCC